MFNFPNSQNNPSRAELFVKQVLSNCTWELYTITFLTCLILLCNLRKRMATASDRAHIPPTISILASVRLFLLHGKDTCQLIKTTSEMFGPVFKTPTIFGLKAVWINDASLIQQILSSNNPIVLNKPGIFYHDLSGNFLKDGLVASDAKTWKKRRAIISKGFTYDVLKAYLGVINRHAHRLLEDVKAMTDKRRKSLSSLNSFYELVHICNIRIISHILTGHDLCGNEECLIFHKNLTQSEEIIAKSMMNPLRFLKPIWGLHPNCRKLKERFSNMYNFTHAILQKYKETNNRPDILQRNSSERTFKPILARMMEAGWSEKEIFAELLTLLIAGHEATSISIDFLLLNLALAPECQLRCRQEIDEMFDKVENEGLTDGIPLEFLSNLNYLERCVKESLRMFPGVPVFSREMTSNIEFDNGLVINKGTHVIFSPLALHHSSEYYPEPSKFDPDRFLAENCKKRHPYAYLPFSAGPRNCIGWKLGLLEVKCISAWILRHFEVVTTDNKLEDVKLNFNIILNAEKGINLEFKERRTSI